MTKPPGIIFFTDGLDARELEHFARRLEELRYGCLFVPEFLGREPFSTASYVLARTETLNVATGIANVYSHDAIVIAQSSQTLAELSGGRFILGLGVSHPQMAEAHGLPWLPPVRKMRETLETIENLKVQSPEPERRAPIWIAAHGPGLLRVVANRADGANTYLMPPAHTKQARETVGPEKDLNVVLPCCLCEDAGRARQVARKALSIYMPLPAYRRQWSAWGYDENDFENGGSDRLIDGAVAWGSEAAIRERMTQHLEAGATRIVVSPYNPEGRGPHWKLIETLAP